jgi:hypothetical protein
MNARAQLATNEEAMRKGAKIIYRTSLGYQYSAIVRRVHRNGDATITVFFPLSGDGAETLGCFQGDVFRVAPCRIVGLFTS